MTNQEIDPVSGNEVPIGASPDEVRDDIDVKMSENEYVIPADVVRFYGVDRFEKMIQKAKEGWKEMEANGRIGGDPVPEEGPSEEDLSPEEQAMLEEALGMAKGGLVKPKAGYAEGGYQGGTPPAFLDGVSSPVGDASSPDPKGIETKTYHGPDGSTRLIMLVNGQPINAIPEGFTEDPPVANVTDEEDEFGPDNAELREAAFENSMAKDYTDMTPEDRVSEAVSGLEMGSMAEKGLGGLLGGMVGGSLAGGLAAKGLDAWGGFGVKGAMAQMIGLEQAGYTTEAGKIQEAIFNQTRFDTREEMEKSKVFGKAKAAVEANKNGMFSSLSGGDGTPSVSGGAGADGLAGSIAAGAGEGTGQASSANAGGTASAGARGVGSEVSAPTASSQSSAQAAVSGSVSAETAAGLSGSQSTNPGGFDNEEGSWGSGPMNKGGLVKKKRKTPAKSKTSTRKGLASKK